MKENKKALKELHNEKLLTPDESASKTLAVLNKEGLPALERIEIVNPITKKKVKIMLRRDGTPESELITTLADPKSTQDRKDYVLSMYLWGRGAESASLMVDLMRYKGEHSKETRVFKSQMRFDFEAFVNVMAEHLRNQAIITGAILDVDIEKEKEAYRAWLKDNPEKTYYEFTVIADRVKCALISQAIFQLDEAERLVASRKNITKAREREKGGGIYVSPTGKAYTVDDPEITEIVKADHEATKSITE